MTEYSQKALQELCQRLEVDAVFFAQCVELSIIEIEVHDERLEVFNGTLLRLRRLQPICDTFDVDISVGLLLLKFSEG